jgi:tRNA(Ile)-lysidine synthase
MNPPLRLQDLPPKQARFCLDVERFLVEGAGAPLNHLTVMCALSGGPDSTALLFSLWYLCPRLNIRLLAAHLDHGLRPESAAEAEHCASLCDELSIELYTERAEPQDTNGPGLEARARRVRYDFLDRARSVYGAHMIATGHTLDDLAEDQLMRMIRGAGWPGLGGMAAHDPERRLVRPLLMSAKSECEAFLNVLGISPVADPSNKDRSFFRNRVRLDILPLFLKENPGYLNNAKALWRMARTDEAHFASEMCEFEHDENGAVVLERGELATLHPALRLRLYKSVIESLGPGQPLAAALFDLDEAFREKQTGKTFQFPGGKTAEIITNGVRFAPPHSA